jgi:hypothetical protein
MRRPGLASNRENWALDHRSRPARVDGFSHIMRATGLSMRLRNGVGCGSQASPRHKLTDATKRLVAAFARNERTE